MMQWSKETILTAVLGLHRQRGAARRTGRVPRPRSPCAPWRGRRGRLVSLATTPSLNLRRPSRSILGLPNDSPRCAPSSASVITFAACSSALDGMQPTFRQTPPSAGSARPAPPSCRGRPRERPRCSRRARSRAPAPRRAGRRRGCRAAPVPGATAGAAGVLAGRLLFGRDGRRRCWLLLGLRLGLRLELRGGRRRRAFRGVEQQDDRALRDPIARPSPSVP